MKNLIICGTGITFLSHLTHEVKTHIEQCDIVLFLVNEPLIQEWITEHSKINENLDGIYQAHELRVDSYNAITQHILKATKTYQSVCVVFYGHPCACTKPGVDAAHLAEKKGINTKILPGISSDACLYSDLKINPLKDGLQSYEATHFLRNQPKFEPRSNLILWQISNIDIQTHERTINLKGLEELQSQLQQHYPSKQPIVIYEASLYPQIQPRIEQTTLEQLLNKKLTPLSTLYIPPAIMDN